MDARPTRAVVVEPPLPPRVNNPLLAQLEAQQRARAAYLAERQQGAAFARLDRQLGAV